MYNSSRYNVASRLCRLIVLQGPMLLVYKQNYSWGRYFQIPYDRKKRILKIIATIGTCRRLRQGLFDERSRSKCPREPVGAARGDSAMPHRPNKCGRV